MKNYILIVIAAISLSGCVSAQTYQSPQHNPAPALHVITVPVVESVPIVEKMVVRRGEQCHTEIQQRSRPGVGGAIVGGLIGAALGNQVGGGSGREIATAAGAVAGATIGNNAQNAPRENLVCEPVYVEQERVVGYRVTYVMGDREITETMSYDPGHSVRIEFQSR